ncbi:MAG: diphthine--ammonia ligase [Candidatus ainarchaeum sp.]|nr:diphthine--ammonia ligase [Candidatus ainarchaeum sp.]MDD3975691.1 diphthine--ammonia ligase [Candidatus ainarchaeum sp.]
MCSIAGSFNLTQSIKNCYEMNVLMQKRGPNHTSFAHIKDNKVYIYEYTDRFEQNNTISHNLLAIVGNISQPIKYKNTLITSNCEIYNWKEICKKEKINARNDSEMLIKLFEKEKVNKKTLEKLDGAYAFCFWKENKIYLARDILGVKPLWFSYENKSFCFASEKKALEKIGREKIEFLDPRKILIYDINKNLINYKKREFIKIKENKNGLEKNKKIIQEKLEQAIIKRIPEKKLALLFSGGIDSTIIAMILKKHKIDFTAYFAHLKGYNENKDLEYVREIAKKYKIKLKIKSLDYKDLEKNIKQVVKTIESTNPIKIGVGLPIYLASKLASKDKNKVIFSGLGSDEIFAGYNRFKESKHIQKDTLNLLYQIHENDLNRDDSLTMENSIELRLPFLDLPLIKEVIGIEDKQKINSEENKIILREISKEYSLDEKYFKRKKVAAQYGSGFDKGIIKLSKENKFKSKSEYLKTFLEKQNLNLGCLYSSGKDSNLSLNILKKQNYKIKCLISIIPENKDSYMYQTPDLKILKAQSECIEIPLVLGKTKGEKEKELIDLKKVIKKAKDKYNLQGIVSGALFSNYQRERIQNICNDLGLRLFSPLWNINQEKEVLKLIKEKFDFRIVKIAGYGLNKDWFLRKIDLKALEELKKLNKKYGFNVAGEGGEFETIVLDSPDFKKKIKVIDYKINLENEFTGEIEIKKIKIEEKRKTNSNKYNQ